MEVNPVEPIGKSGTADGVWKRGRVKISLINTNLSLFPMIIVFKI
jgi:hypothetical protein